MNKYVKASLLVTLAVGSTYVFAEAAGDSQNLASIADNVRKNLAAVVNLIYGIAFLAGIAFFLTGLVKFKAHKDNPTQVPLSAPLVLISISACLMFLPSLMNVAGSTVFGGSQTSASDALQSDLNNDAVFSAGS